MAMLSHKRINDISKELSAYNYAKICLQKNGCANLGSRKNLMIV
jgi:hypothetical protein